MLCIDYLYFSSQGIHTAITNESTYHTLQRELCVPKAVSYLNMTGSYDHSLV